MSSLSGAHGNLTSLTVFDHPDSFVTADNGHTFLHFQYIEDTGTEIHRHTSPLCLDFCSARLMPKLLVVRHYCLSVYLPFQGWTLASDMDGLLVQCSI